MLALASFRAGFSQTFAYSVWQRIQFFMRVAQALRLRLPFRSCMDTFFIAQINAAWPAAAAAEASAGADNEVQQMYNICMTFLMQF